MMEQIVGTKLDYAIIIIYFIFVLGFGSVFGRFTRTTKEFYQVFCCWLSLWNELNNDLFK